MHSLRKFIGRTFGPLFLLVCCPLSVLVLWFTATSLHGDLGALVSMFREFGPVTAFWTIIGPVWLGSPTAWAIIGVFAALQLLMMRILPARMEPGSPAPSGFIPQYRANGPASYVITLLLFAIFSWGFGIFSPGIVYRHLGEILGALNIFSLLFCLLLYAKGLLYPSSPDHGGSGNFIFDYYWGTELYPSILGFNVKQFTNCRMGMTGWALMNVSYMGYQMETYGLSNTMFVCVALQVIYLMKFFVWEIGYLRTTDITRDRAGFYICWGCLVWVPSLYTLPGMYLADKPHDLPTWLAFLIFAAGVAAIYINYQADRQRQEARERGGEMKIWGKPVAFVSAPYTTGDGEKRTSLLLTSGWWGVAFHFHYVPELVAAFMWTVPARFESPVPYFYFIFLFVLLMHRLIRDEEHCSKKYGPGWVEYRKAVPWTLLPGLRMPDILKRK